MALVSVSVLAADLAAWTRLLGLHDAEPARFEPRRMLYYPGSAPHPRQQSRAHTFPRSSLICPKTPKLGRVGAPEGQEGVTASAYRKESDLRLGC
ncbi:hypothetical protein FH610_000025 [Microbispora catharanthi]|uniref:Uncharacterized protein n=1 Tax=Microbispora catharanthi TaxID=1712871 RepID=A0A5N6C4J6_9ACTN|nr:hypothetical protein FH610_000025 [Microbispora catharanthi]